MKALCWHGRHDVRIENVADPEIINDRDAIIKITSTAICGSDLHLYNNLMPTMEKGDILGHEFMGEVVELGSAIKHLKKGDKIVVPFTISCGSCAFCKKELYSLCDYSNPNAEMARKKLGHATAALFGYSHMMGGYSGGQSEYVRVPYADIGPIKVSKDIPDEKVLFLSDILPTAYMAVENCTLNEGDTLCIWGSGPVGLLAMKCGWLLGAGRVIAIDSIPERLALAQKIGHAETINFEKESVYQRLMVMTKGKGPDACIDAVGTEAHGFASLDSLIDRIKVATYLGTDRAHVLREMIQCCKKGGIISILGVYISKVDNLPMGAAMNKGLSFKMGQTHVQRYLKKLLNKIETHELDPSEIISHRIPLKDAPEAYKTFNARSDHCVKVIMTP